MTVGSGIDRPKSTDDLARGVELNYDALLQRCLSAQTNLYLSHELSCICNI